MRMGSSHEELIALEIETGPFHWITYSADGNVLAARSEGGVTHCWLAPSWEEIERAEQASSGPPRGLHAKP